MFGFRSGLLVLFLILSASCRNQVQLPEANSSASRSNTNPNDTQNDDQKSNDPLNEAQRFSAFSAVMYSKCISCHNTNSPFGDFAQYQSAEEWASSPYVTRGDPLTSSIYFRMAGSLGNSGPKNMPTDGDFAEGSELQAVADFIQKLQVDVAPTITNVSGLGSSGTISIDVGFTGDASLVKFQVFDQSLNLSAEYEDEAAPYRWNLNTQTLTNGDYSLRIDIFDMTQTISDTEQLSLNINNKTPPTPPSIVSINGLGSIGTITIEASTMGDASRVDFQILDGASQMVASSTDSSPPFEWTFNTNQLANASYTLQAEVFDVAQTLADTKSQSFDINNQDIPDVPGPDATPEERFLAAKNVIDTYCANCHTGYHSSWQNLTTEDDYLALRAGQIDLITPGDVSASYLLRRMTFGSGPANNMPIAEYPENPPFVVQHYEIIESWIANMDTNDNQPPDMDPVCDSSVGLEDRIAEKSMKRLSRNQYINSIEEVISELPSQDRQAVMGLIEDELSLVPFDGQVENDLDALSFSSMDDQISDQHRFSYNLVNWELAKAITADETRIGNFLRRFCGDQTYTNPGGSGLAGDYYNNDNLTDLAFSRVDSEINFNFAQDGHPVADDYYSIRWNGNVVADEDGSHTITVSADDGVRIWFDGELVIDEWSGGAASDRIFSHTQNLAAGESYPIRIEYYQGRFEASIHLYWTKPDSVQETISGNNLAQNGSGGIRSACVDTFIEEFGRLTQRRPLSSDEITQYRALFDASDDGYAQLIYLFLSMPEFLYIAEVRGPEVAPGIYALDAYELASRISLGLGQVIPDETLLDAAESGALDDASTRSQVVEDFIESDKFKNSLRQFHTEWLRLADTSEVRDPQEIDSNFFNFISQSYDLNNVHEDSIEEVHRMFEYHAFTAGDTYEDVFTTPYSFAQSPQLAAIYGVQPYTPGLPPVSLPSDRGGLYTLAFFNISSSGTNRPFHYGARFFREGLCRIIEDPEGSVPDDQIVLPPQSPNQSTREVAEIGTSGPECSGCHSQFNDVSFAFEQYNALGVSRMRQDGNVYEITEVDYNNNQVLSEVVVNMDLVPRIADPTDDTVVTGPVEMMQHAVETGQPQACYGRHFYSFVMSRPFDADKDACAVVDRKVDFRDLSLVEAYQAIVESPEFQHVRPKN